MPLDIRLRERNIETSGWTAIDLTEKIQEIVGEEGLLYGIVTVFTPEKDVVVTTVEYEVELLADLENLIGKLGGPSGVVEALIGKTTTIPVVEGRLETGAFKRIVLIDISKNPGAKKVIVALEGIYS